MLTKRWFIVICFFAVKCDLCMAQAGEWTWMKGSSGNALNAVYGTQGVAASANTPQGFYEPCEWRDKNGNFWLYGGAGWGSDFSNLWKYDPSVNEWTWVKGPGAFPNQPPVYGTLGVPAINNTPGARSYGISTWVDTAGSLWLFGGTFGLSDLWKYDIATNEWAWMNGPDTYDQPGVYGVQGVSDPANHPGGRSEACATWTDVNNNLWFFGGYGYDKYGTIGLFNDVWKYSISSNEWTWIRGATTGNNAGSYGTKGVTDTVNNPPSRMVFAKWTDLSGNFWLFAGGDWTIHIYFNDVWKYDPMANKWTWMSGTSILNNGGTTDSLCAAGIDLVGPARFENRACWTDSCGNFWVFGGARGNAIDTDYNDLWYFSPQSLEWIQVGGSVIQNQAGSYGTQGVSSATNQPPSRGGSVSWLDLSGNLWVWGGTKNFTVFFNDLWRYIRDPLCPVNNGCVSAPSVAFYSTDTFLCEKFCIGFFDQSVNNPSSWEWLFLGGTPSSSADQNPTNICYNLPGTYDVTLITTNAIGDDTLTLPNYITVYPTPSFPTITQSGYTLTSSLATSYQWQLNSVDIPGATDQSYTVMQTGLYTVIVGDANGCVNSATRYVLITGIHDVTADVSISIYPNPSSGSFMVECLSAFCGSFAGDEISISIFNALGQEIFSSEETFTSSYKKQIEVSGIASGVYFLGINSNHFSVKRKIVIER